MPVGRFSFVQNNTSGTSSGIEVGVTPSDGTADALLKTNASGEVDNASGITNPAEGSLSIVDSAERYAEIVLNGANLNPVTLQNDSLFGTARIMGDGGTIFADGNGFPIFGAISSSGFTLVTGVLVIPSAPPATAGATGTAGTVTWDANFIYICVAADTWKRVAISTW